MTTYDPALIERLVAEVRTDDYAMTPGPWETGEEDNAATLRARPSIRGGTPEAPVDVIITFGRAYSDARGIARTRNNLAAMADQLEAARREVERANKEWSSHAASIIAERDALRSEVAGLEQQCSKWSSDFADLAAENERLREVLKWAEAWRDADVNDDTHESNLLLEAVDAYRAAKDRP